MRIAYETRLLVRYPSFLKVVPMKDNWTEKVSEMTCQTCAFYVSFRCRRNAPTINGFPAVYPTDWCGNHRLDKTKMREMFESKQTTKEIEK